MECAACEYYTSFTSLLGVLSDCREEAREEEKVSNMVDTCCCFHAALLREEMVGGIGEGARSSILVDDRLSVGFGDRCVEEEDVETLSC